MSVRLVNEIPIQDITQNDLQFLIDEEIVENRTLEYKREINVETGDDKKEFLADVSSFANAEGGDIIFGIECDSGTKLPINLYDVSRDGKDKDIQTLENIIRDGIEPRMSFDINTIELSDNPDQGYAIIIRIKKGWDGPYRIKYKSNHRFYTRSSNGKYLMEMNELRTAFNLSETRIERIKTFVQTRLSNIYSNESSYPLGDGPILSLHLVPASSFDSGSYYDLSIISNKRENPSYPMKYHSYNPIFNLDGFLKYSKLQNEPFAVSYLQYFRNGVIESACLLDHKGVDERKISISSIEYLLFGPINGYIRDLESLGIISPFIIFISLINVKGCMISLQNRLFSEKGPDIYKDVVQLPDVYIEGYSQDIKKALKPCFDVLANLGGLSRSYSYDEDGNYIGEY